jgi:hypothetical protein
MVCNPPESSSLHLSMLHPSLFHDLDKRSRIAPEGRPLPLCAAKGSRPVSQTRRVLLTSINQDFNTSPRIRRLLPKVSIFSPKRAKIDPPEFPTVQ